VSSGVKLYAGSDDITDPELLKLPRVPANTDRKEHCRKIREYGLPDTRKKVSKRRRRTCQHTYHRKVAHDSKPATTPYFA
jgi:hypothetical protein